MFAAFIFDAKECNRKKVDKQTIITSMIDFVYFTSYIGYIWSRRKKRTERRSCECLIILHFKVNDY